MRPISGNVTLPTPVRILLGKLTYHIGIVNLKKNGVELPQMTKEINIVRKSTVSFRINDIVAPNAPFIRECDATYCSHLLGILTYHIGIEKIRG